MQQYVRWIAARGAPLGFRFPSAEERVRATGFPSLIQAFGLPPRAAYDAVGRHFDPRALHLRCRPLLRAWASNHPLSRHTFLDPSALTAVYESLRRDARAEAPLLIPFRDPQGGFAPRPVQDSLRRLRLWRDDPITVSPERGPGATTDPPPGRAPGPATRADALRPRGGGRLPAAIGVRQATPAVRAAVPSACPLPPAADAALSLPASRPAPPSARSL